jgi:hypothetical protein
MLAAVISNRNSKYYDIIDCTARRIHQNVVGANSNTVPTYTYGGERNFTVGTPIVKTGRQSLQYQLQSQDAFRLAIPVAL